MHSTMRYMLSTRRTRRAMRTDDRLNKLMDDRLKKLKYVGQRRGELLMEATRQSHAKGQRHGRKEERARLLAQVDALWDAWEAKYEIGASSYDEGALAALDQVLVLLREDTPHE